MGRETNDERRFRNFAELKKVYKQCSTYAKKIVEEHSMHETHMYRTEYDRGTLLNLGRARAYFEGDACDLPGFATAKRESDPVADPRLDDEVLIGALETRLSQESGADARNLETFGDCSGGWSFEEALEANQGLLRRQEEQKAHQWGADACLGGADNSLLALRERGRRLLDTMGTSPGQATTRNDQFYASHRAAFYPSAGYYAAKQNDQFYADPHATFYASLAGGYAASVAESDLRAEAPCFEPVKTVEASFLEPAKTIPTAAPFAALQRPAKTIPTAAGVRLGASSSLFGTVPTGSLAPAGVSSKRLPSWLDRAAEIPPTDGLRIGAPCFEPGVCAYECLSTDDGAGESCGGDTAASEDGEMDDNLATQ